MKKTTDRIITVLFFICLFIALVFAADYGIKKSERNECDRWNNENVELKGWQIKQCENVQQP